MEMITPEEVIRRIEGFLTGGTARTLDPNESILVRNYLSLSGKSLSIPILPSDDA
jgi:hypothetical protein